MIRRGIVGGENRLRRIDGARVTKVVASILCAFTLALVVVSCSNAPSAPDAALSSLSADRLLANIKRFRRINLKGADQGQRRKFDD